MTARKKPEVPAATTVDVVQCLALLTDVARAASTDPTLSMINGVLLHGEMHDGKPRLVGTATDRFLMAQGSVDATGVPLPEVFVPLTEVKRVVTVLKTLPRASTLLEISVPGDGVAVFSARGASATTEPASTGRIPAFPDFAHLFTVEVPTEDANKTAVMGYLLTRLAAVSKARNEPMRIAASGPSKPTLIQVGGNFRALIMPCRVNEIEPLPLFIPPSEQARIGEKAAAKAKRDAERAAAEEAAEVAAKTRHPAGKKPAVRKAPARTPAAKPAPRRTSRAKAAA